MKKGIVIIVILLSIAAVVMGKLHWNNKIQANARTAQVVKPENVEVKTVAENKVREVEAYSKKLPKEIQTKLISAAQSDEYVNFVIAGSSATPEESLGWPSLLKEDLESAYGENFLNVTIKEFADKSSTEVVQEELYEEIISLSPDILLLEPFILYDNEMVVPIDKRLVNITNIIDAIKAEFPEVIVLLQPANPLHNAINYPKEVNEFKEYAEEHNLIFLNHWDAWPDYQSVEIREYLINGTPNEKGNEVWADYLSEYFIAHDGEN